MAVIKALLRYFVRLGFDCRYYWLRSYLVCGEKRICLSLPVVISIKSNLCKCLSSSAGTMPTRRPISRHHAVCTRYPTTITDAKRAVENLMVELHGMARRLRGYDLIALFYTDFSFDLVTAAIIWWLDAMSCLLLLSPRLPLPGIPPPHTVSNFSLKLMMSWSPCAWLRESRWALCLD